MRYAIALVTIGMLSGCDTASPYQSTLIFSEEGGPTLVGAGNRVALISDSPAFRVYAGSADGSTTTREVTQFGWPGTAVRCAVLDGATLFVTTGSGTAALGQFWRIDLDGDAAMLLGEYPQNSCPLVDDSRLYWLGIDGPSLLLFEVGTRTGDVERVTLQSPPTSLASGTLAIAAAQGQLYWGTSFGKWGWATVSSGVADHHLWRAAQDGSGTPEIVVDLKEAVAAMVEYDGDILVALEAGTIERVRAQNGAVEIVVDGLTQTRHLLADGATLYACTDGRVVRLPSQAGAASETIVTWKGPPYCSVCAIAEHRLFYRASDGANCSGPILLSEL
jgi:hypothetical protein